MDTLNFKYNTWRPLKFNSSVQYSFGDGRNSTCSCEGNEMVYKNSVGAQLFAMSAPRTPLMALTAYYRRKLFESLEMKATYTVDSFSAKNIGLGLSATIAKVNFYILADNLLEYRDISKANSLSFQLGFNIIFPDKNTPRLKQLNDFYFELLRLNHFVNFLSKLPIQIPTRILIPICVFEIISNIKKWEKTGTINSKLVIKMVIPMIIGTKLFLYFNVVKYRIIERAIGQGQENI